jgi:PKHD-type hydroxylase
MEHFNMYLKNPCFILNESAGMPSHALDRLKKYVDNVKLQPAETIKKTGAGAPPRESGVAFLEFARDLQFLYENVDKLVKRANQLAGWNFDYSYIEPLQYTVYGKGQFYDWHTDNGSKGEHSKRKLSFTMLLDDEDSFEGGDFQIEWGNPNDGEKRIHTLNLKTAGSIVVFPSHVYHRVTEVTKGTRRSLVGWIHGPAFK